MSNDMNMQGSSTCMEGVLYTAIKPTHIVPQTTQESAVGLVK